MSEARNYQRYRIPFPLTYAVDDGKQGVLKKGSIQDVSEGGALITAQESVREGSNVRLFIEVGGRKFRLIGKVIRSYDPKWLQQNMLAIIFTKVSDVFKMRMIEQVVKIEGYRLWKAKKVGAPVEEYDAASEWMIRFRDKRGGSKV